ncbi:MAG: glutamine--fructose-6-phosphate transaminase (isomerizing) [Pseudobdellovibrionaceae bacterium]|nr:glutamine--fructose-6-phosphate transaminase (isomerizing) [Pseudobdellovibrionaceae bacterium]
MCGIVGYLGSRDPKDIIIEGLSKLEYRGYDSAGVAIFNENQLVRVRAEGKLSQLKQKIQDLNLTFTGPSGIGHTRWATHGRPSEHNAHPHSSGPIMLVHNGIIENYLELKKELMGKGYQFESDTDSEVVAHLINDRWKQYGNLLTAIKRVLPELKGAFSIVVLNQENPNELVAFKDGPPLILGLGQNEYFLVSDVAASLAYTSRYIYLDDREIVRVTPEGYAVFSESGVRLSKTVTEVAWSADQVEKRGFRHYMLKEIYEQARSVAHCLEPFLDREQFRLKPMMEWSSVEGVHIVACGTSFYAGIYGQYLMEILGGIPCRVDVASEFRYRDPVLSPGTLVLAISQSGETADTLGAVRLAKAQGSPVVSICNVKQSSLDRESDVTFYMNCGPEIGVASTKAFTATLVLLNLLAMDLARYRKRLNADLEFQMLRRLLELPSQIEVVLAYDKYFQDAADALKRYRGFLFLGRHVLYPIAMEGALKLKELSYLHAEGYPAGEMKHGPLALIDEQMAVVVLAPQDDLYEKTLSNLQEVKARGAKVIAVGTLEDEQLKSLSDRYLSIPKVPWNINPILAVIPLQLMAYHLACSLGHDVDQPRNLAKSVTVE